MIRDYLEIGTIVGTHGIKGELRVNPACDGPLFFRGFKTLYYDHRGERPVRVLAARAHKSLALLTLEGVDSLALAQAMRGRRLYFRRADAKLAQGQYFVAELLGCRVYDADNPALCYGEISNVSSAGRANDVWHIKPSAGPELLIPVIPDVVKEVDIEAGRIAITPLNGLFEPVEIT
ncbi:MAG: ribosome maturation factor RimM [Oscillospiraceae bacterium]|nr:ribosome maturation factor RimM [Oscillospiraceae bacterium]